MDYEKLHKDTIAKLQEMVNSGKITVETAQGICADFVPVSDDEKLREQVIYAINQLHVCDCTKNKLRAWLEKQGEQKPTDKYNNWYNFIRWFVKQRTDDYTLIPSDDDIHKWGDNILNHARKVLEQKPAWNEEDEYYLNSCITKIEIDIQNWDSHGKTGIDADKEIISWLKSLKDRVQPKITWKPSDK